MLYMDPFVYVNANESLETFIRLGVRTVFNGETSSPFGAISHVIILRQPS